MYGLEFGQLPASPTMAFAEDVQTPAGMSMSNWSLTTDGRDVRDNVLEAFDDLCAQFGGPQQYLDSTYPDAGARKKFADQLLKILPLDMSKGYMVCGPITKTTSLNDPQIVKFHPACFAFSKSSSLKPPPLAHTCKKLMDEILVNGFLTSTDVIQAKEISEMLYSTNRSPETIHPVSTTHTCGKMDGELCAQKIQCGGVGYVKGASRTTTLLCLLSMFIEDDVDLAAVLPCVAETASVIHCIFPSCANSRQEFFWNFRLSFAGSIRERPNLFTWIGVLRSMSALGDSDSGSIVKQWNTEAPKANKLVGAMATNLKFMLEKMDVAVLDALCGIVSKDGFENQPFHDSSFSSKKCVVGVIFRHSAPGWEKILKVSTKSILLMINSKANVHRKTPVFLRKKMDSKSIDTALEEATLLDILMELVLKKQPCVCRIGAHSCQGIHGWRPNIANGAREPDPHEAARC